MKNTMVKNKTLLASAILALTAVSSGAYATAVSEQHSINLTAEINPVGFYVKPQTELEASYKLTYDEAQETLSSLSIPFMHRNRGGQAITAILSTDAELRNDQGHTIPLSVSYDSTEIKRGSSIQIAAAQTEALMQGANSTLRIAPTDFKVDDNASGEYTGTVTINFESEI